MRLEAKNLIGGKAIVGCDESTFNGFNPVTNKVLEPSYSSVSDHDFELAMSLAQDSFLIYRQVSADRRADFLEQIATEIEALGATLIERAMLETALTQARLEGERARTCSQLRLFAQLLRDGGYKDLRHDAALPDRKPLARPEIYSHKIALGPVAVFGASNFPLAFSVAGGDTASALAAGCPVVVKAHNAHLGTSELVGRAVVKAIEKCSIPVGVFALLYGEGHTLGQKLAQHWAISAIAFTGSRAGGTALMQTATQRKCPIPVYAEMSSINPVFILPQALEQNPSGIARGLTDAMQMGAGQFCTSPGLVFVVRGNGFDEFIQTAQTAINQASSQTMLTQGIVQAYSKGVHNLSHVSALLAEGKVSSEPNQCQPRLYKAKPTQFKDVLDEVFGACAVIVECDSVEQMLDLTSTLEGQLTASIHAASNENMTLMKTLVKLCELKAGRIIFNAFGTGVEVCSAMVHGGPYPATSDGRSTSVGTAAIERFLRPVCYQNLPPEVLEDLLN